MNVRDLRGWALTRPERLGAEARSLIEDRRTRVLVSAASAWEIATKLRLGKLDQATALVAGYVDYLLTLGVEELAITSEHALMAGRFRSSHRDPFDRMIAAQALIEGAVVVTDDEAFEAFDCSTLW